PEEGSGSLGLVEEVTFPVHALAFRPDGLTLAVAGADGVVRLWDVTATATGSGPVAYSPVEVPPTVPVAELAGHDGFGHVLAYSGDGTTLAVGFGLDNGSVRVWDVADQVRPVERAPLSGHDSPPVALSFS
nr:hypothetical protein [Micromonospora sp. DSM 115978]